MNDEFLFAEDDEDIPAPEIDGVWKVLIVDDEPEIHAVTKLALSEFVLNGKALIFLSAFSGEQAIEMFKQHDDIAVVLLDVVMETDDAGLRVAHTVRNTLNNNFTRIILRTGQPGQAPEKDIIVNYDINDYKSKTELTAQKLFTVIIASLRSYRDIMSIEESRVGLEKVIRASTDLFSRRSLEQFMEGLIQQLSSVLGCSQDAAYITSAVAGHEPITDNSSEKLYIFTGNGEYQNFRGSALSDALSGEEFLSCKSALSQKSIVFAKDHIVAYCGGKSDYGSLLYLSGLHRMVTDTDRLLIKLFSENVQVAFENVMRINHINAKQSNVLNRLCQVTDACSNSHIKLVRTVAMADCVGRGMGLSEERVKQMRLAIPLVGLEFSCLVPLLLDTPTVNIKACMESMTAHTNKTTADAEFEEIAFFKQATMLSQQHHERWDGKGYPNKLIGNEIAQESQILSAVYMFDTLLNQKPYASQWTLSDVVEFFESQRDKAFSAKVTHSILSNRETLAALQKSLPDNLFIQ